MSSCNPRVRSALFSAAIGWGALVGTYARGQTVENGLSLALHSSGTASGTGWNLSTDGYVGTYVTLSQPTAVTLTAAASGVASAGVSPDLAFSIGSSTQSFAVTTGSSNNYTYTTPTLAAGTYFVRTQLDDQTATATPTLTLASLTIGGTGVAVSNSNSSANALAAANTYAANYRSGAATVTLTDPAGHALGADTAAHIQLTRNAFNFTLAVTGQSPTASSDGTTWLNYNKTTGQYITPAAGSTQATYQSHLLQNFNSIVPTNAGKWQNNEYTSGSVNMSLVDAETQFASQNGLGERMHNLIWYNQQPAFIGTDFTSKNTAAINTAITNRIKYYVSNNGVLGTPRADSYTEMDVLNEPVHGVGQTDDYQTVLGVAGVASVYSQVATAAKAAGASTRLYTNEYNVLQNSVNPTTNANDPYANWYLNEITKLNNAGYGHVVTGTGSELYTYYSSNAPSLSPATMMQAMQNLAVAGNPFSLTEFGESTSSTATPSAATFAADLTTALTMDYGNPAATTFGFWGGLGGSVDANAITSLYDSNWNLTAVGQAYQQWMSQYQTNLNLTTDANGNLLFTGTYGTYDLTINGQDYQFTLSPGSTQIALTVVPEPAAVRLWSSILAGAACLRRQRRSNSIAGS